MSNTFKWFIFNQCRFRRDWVEVTIRHEGKPDRTVQITDATYNRFVALANSGLYNVDIQPAGSGLAWELCRCPQPESEPEYTGISDAATLFFVPRPECPVEADGNILWA
jgi:hypothetical protein